MKKIILTILGLFGIIQVYGQNINLDQISKTKRDSILIAETKNVINVFADADFYNKTNRQPLIRKVINFHTKRGVIFPLCYEVTYLYDLNTYMMECEFLSQTTIDAVTGKAVQLRLGTGYGLQPLSVYDGVVIPYDDQYGWWVNEPYERFRSLFYTEKFAKQQAMIAAAASYEASGDIFTEGIDNSGGNLGDIGGGKPKKP